MIDWLLSTLWYGSLLLIVVSMVALIRPIRRLRLASRVRALSVLAAAILLLMVNARWAPAAQSIATQTTALDRFVPAYHFREIHRRRVAAPPATVLHAARAVTAGEIRLFSTFTAIRRFGRPGPESILDAPEHQPILDVATRTSFLLLAQTDREVVIGTLVAVPPGFTMPATRDAVWFASLTQPGVAKAAMNFAVTPDAGGTRLTTETRVFGSDAAVVRRFTPYWRTIFPGSWILRVTWLDAIAARAERAQ